MTTPDANDTGTVPAPAAAAAPEPAPSWLERLHHRIDDIEAAVVRAAAQAETTAALIFEHLISGAESAASTAATDLVGLPGLVPVIGEVASAVKTVVERVCSCEHSDPHTANGCTAPGCPCNGAVQAAPNAPSA